MFFTGTPHLYPWRPNVTGSTHNQMTKKTSDKCFESIDPAHVPTPSSWPWSNTSSQNSTTNVAFMNGNIEHSSPFNGKGMIENNQLFNNNNVNNWVGRDRPDIKKDSNSLLDHITGGDPGNNASPSQPW